MWIAPETTILKGVVVADNCILASKSLLTKSVAESCLVAGVPAKEIRTRFDGAVVDELEKIKWWDKPKDWIENHAEDFDNPLRFIKQHRVKGESGR